MHAEGEQHGVQAPVAVPGEEIDVMPSSAGVPLPPPGGGAGFHQGDQGVNKTISRGGTTCIRTSLAAGFGSDSHGGRSAGPASPSAASSKGWPGTHCPTSAQCVSAPGEGQLASALVRLRRLREPGAKSLQPLAQNGSYQEISRF